MWMFKVQACGIVPAKYQTVHVWNSSVWRASLSTICLWLQGTPSYARFIPIRAIFLPVILLQVAGLSFALWRFFNRLVVKLQDGTMSERHLSVSSKVDELSMIIQYGSRFYLFFITDISSTGVALRIHILSIVVADQAPLLVVYWWR